MTSKLTPRVSILVPSYNYGWCIADAVHSVLNQNFQDFELIIADDGSSDNSWPILETLQKNHPSKIKIFHHPHGAHRGLPATYQLALEQAKGHYLAFLEADDLWTPENLEKKVQALEQNPDAGLVFSSCKPFGDTKGSLYWNLYLAAVRGETAKNRATALWRPFLKRNPVATFSSFMTYRHLWAEIPPPAPPHLNYDWWVLAHLAIKTSFYFIPEPLVHWRIHRESAHYGPITPQKTRRLQNFLANLYVSLRARTADPQIHSALETADEELSYYRNLFKKDTPFQAWFLLAKKPFETARFLAHLVLRRLLTSHAS